MAIKIEIQNDRVVKISTLKRGEKFIVDWATRDTENIYVNLGILSNDKSCGMITTCNMVTGQIKCFNGYETVTPIEINDIQIKGYVK